MNNNDFINALLENDVLKAKEIFYQHADPHNVLQIVEQFIVPSLTYIGDGWQNNEISLSQVYMSGKAVETLVDEILPPADPHRKNLPKMAIAVLEDYHMLGKRIVFSILRASGYELLDYDRVTVDELVQKVEADKIKVLLISTLMLPSALRVKNLITALNQQGNKPTVIVGGAPFRLDTTLCQEVGADGTADNVAEMLKLIENIMKNGQ